MEVKHIAHQNPDAGPVFVLQQVKAFACIWMGHGSYYNLYE